MNKAEALTRALLDPNLRPLPDHAAALLLALEAPPRLAAHLRLVHDVAAQLADRLRDRYPGLEFDCGAVLFGAATHDIGKAVHTAELSGPGSLHEEEGRALLLSRGVEPGLARFAATHASWNEPDIALEDLLVSLADKAWKRQRANDLEDLVVACLAESAGLPSWEAFGELDAILTDLGREADERLVFQSGFPVH